MLARAKELGYKQQAELPAKLADYKSAALPMRKTGERASSRNDS